MGLRVRDMSSGEGGTCEDGEAWLWGVNTEANGVTGDRWRQVLDLCQVGAPGVGGEGRVEVLSRE